MNVLYPLREGKNDPEGDSEISRAAIPTMCVEHTGPEGKAISFLVSEGRTPSWFQEARLPLPSASGAGLQQEATGWGCCPEQRGQCHCLGLWG